MVWNVPLNPSQELYEDILSQFKFQFERSHALSDGARSALLQEVQGLLNNEAAALAAPHGDAD